MKIYFLASSNKNGIISSRTTPFSIANLNILLLAWSGKIISFAMFDNISLKGWNFGGSIVSVKIIDLIMNSIVDLITNIEYSKNIAYWFKA